MKDTFIGWSLSPMARTAAIAKMPHRTDIDMLFSSTSINSVVLPRRFRALASGAVEP